MQKELGLILFLLQHYTVEGTNCLHRVSTGVETQKGCFTHTIMRATTEWENPGSARKTLSDCICYKRAGHRLLQPVGRVSAVLPGKWTPT
jgi:hypothetical protein